MSGPSLILDPRIHAYRKDIADIALAGQLFAPHYARPMTRSCGLLPAPLRASPSDTAETISELLPGEEFAVVDVTGHWAWGYCRADHKVGYVEAIALADPFVPTHIVVEATAPVEASIDLLSPTIAALPMGSRLRGTEKGAMLAIEGGFVPLSHLRRIDEHEDDPAAICQRLLGAPYADGGRTLHGIDCSGLVQLALALCGVPAPRDVDQQRTLGDPLPDGVSLVRGDLVFCEQHVGMMIDDRMVIHVSPVSGKVAVEPLRDAQAHCPHKLDRRRIRT
ncbi:C40 family peptidase [Sphingosinicella rhizophila]|uniref:NlpC/P60 family protein n=1 Tax=Sphingosinicella rhizophila TaxID=3050082 RepID=A0ABU3Q4H8_9SPHN|nr:NlpC/P60 family protein [Sphingosinicella sp. GR2756]MDT9597835.1 NlpC/P60 family protein [Sphingosinicella sp. GR2756]